MANPCFDNVLAVLNRMVPDRPTLFEMFMNTPLYLELAGEEFADPQDDLGELRLLINAFKNGGYDYATVRSSGFLFPRGEAGMKATRSLNEGSLIRDRKSFEEYPWPDPYDFDASRLEKIAPDLPDGMKLAVMGPGGVLENVIDLVGYEALCFMLVDDPRLVQDIFARVGQTIVRYYQQAAPYDTVGVLISNDDWGFNTQTMLSPEDMRRFVFPWHEEIVSVIHQAGKPAILHSCGNLSAVMDDLIDGIGYDGKHSFEDKIKPVEEAYEEWGHRIAILGGIDLDFLCRETPDKIKERAASLVERTASRGGYALGSGNSIPEYVPVENYRAMVSAAREQYM
ncbi:MAG: uroporphyrinogen decarboxylase family protein [Bacillota bacterium]|jgi:uroporphyrinogen decarboxylase|nr:uroporphyrinogen decarboxylase family protein [Bacillota bacterium]HHT90073.1 uroporphyrinogen-III decarboxylase-like protein [Bacillota bacterium]